MYMYKKERKTRHSRLIFQPKIEEEGTRDIVDDDFCLYTKYCIVIQFSNLVGEPYKFESSKL